MRILSLAVAALLAAFAAQAQEGIPCPPPQPSQTRSQATQADLLIQRARCLHNRGVPVPGLEEARELELEHIALHDQAQARLAGTERALHLPLHPRLLLPGETPRSVMAKILLLPQSSLAGEDGSRHHPYGAKGTNLSQKQRDELEAEIAKGFSQEELARLRLSRVAGEGRAGEILKKTRIDSAPVTISVPLQVAPGTTGNAPAPVQAYIAKPDLPEDPHAPEIISGMAERAGSAQQEELRIRRHSLQPQRIRPVDMASDPKGRGRIARSATGDLSPRIWGDYDIPHPEEEAKAATRRTLETMKENPHVFGLRPGWQSVSVSGACHEDSWPGRQLAVAVLGKKYTRYKKSGLFGSKCKDRQDDVPKEERSTLEWLSDFKAERYHACMAETPKVGASPWLLPRCEHAMTDLHLRAAAGDESQWRELRGGARLFVQGIEDDLDSISQTRSALPQALAEARTFLDRMERNLQEKGRSTLQLAPRRCMLKALEACAGEPIASYLDADPWNDKAPWRASCIPECTF